MYKKRIDFMLIGAQKAGTTSLHAYLSKQNQVVFSRQKELHYFCKGDLVEDVDYTNYHQCFNLENIGKPIGECTPDYLPFLDSPARIAEYNPNIKLICILRHPLDRAFSHWNMKINQRKETKSFYWVFLLDFIESFKTKINNNISSNYFRKSLYSVQLGNYYKYFDKSQVLVLKYDDYRNDPLGEINKIYKFLDLPSLQDIEQKEVYKIPYSKKLNPVERKLYNLLYRSEIIRLEKLLNWDLQDWKNK